MSTLSRRILIGGVLGGTTSVGTKRVDPSSAEAAAGARRVTKVAAKPRASASVDAGKRIRFGVIGTGAAGREYVQRLLARGKTTHEVELTAVCDVYEPNRRHAVALAELEPRNGHVNYRELLSRQDVDAVVIATPNHWHSRMAMDALGAGKDVYLEPPMALTLEESRQVHNAVTSYKRVLQIASPEVADPRYRLASELIATGEIGQVMWAQGTYSSNAVEGVWNNYVDTDASSSSLNWDLWLGPATGRPFSPERFFRWRKYWDYSGGIATEVFFHKLAALMTALGRNMPNRVTAAGGIFVFKDREVPDTYSMQVEYPNFYVSLAASTATEAPNRFLGDVIYGSRGTITIGKNAVQVHSEPVWDAKLPESKRGMHQFEVEPRDLVEEHISNFLEGVRARRQPLLDTTLGLEIMTPVILGMDSYRLGVTRHYDTHSNRVTERAMPRLGYEGNGRNHPDVKKG